MIDMFVNRRAFRYDKKVIAYVQNGIKHFAGFYVNNKKT